jgi:hypothetical protein
MSNEEGRIFKIIKKEELEDWKKTGHYYGSVIIFFFFSSQTNKYSIYFFNSSFKKELDKKDGKYQFFF